MRDDLVKTDCSTERTLIEIIYEGAIEKQRWPRLLPTICSQLGCQGLGVSVGHPGEKWPGHMILDAQRTGEILEPSRWQNLILDDPIPYWNMESGKVYRMSDLVDPSTLRTTSFYRELLEPAGYESFLCVALDAQDSARVWVFLYRDRKAGDFAVADLERCQTLIPHLQLALRLMSRIQESETVSATYGEAIDGLNVGAIMLDRSGRIRTSNLAARVLIESEDTPLGISEGRLRLRGSIGPVFDSLVRRVLDRTEAEVQQVLAVPRAGMPPLGLLVRACPNRGKGTHLGPEVVVYLSDPTTSSMTSEEVVGELFALSPAEARLASHIAAGLTLADAALKLGLSEASTRTYSKRIYSKIGVCRQADLVRLLLRSVATLAAGPQ